jgi:uncharacterized membrane protein
MALKAVLILVTLTYPFLVYWGIQNYDAAMLLPLLAVMLVLRWFTDRQGRDRRVIVFSIIGLMLVTLFAGARQGLMFYPVLVNAGLLLVFASSLFAHQTVIEKIARIKEPDLPPEGVAYTRKVTWVWCGFFLFNGFVSALTIAWGSEQLWMLYNGFISYLLIALLVVGEWVVRYRIKRKI